MKESARKMRPERGQKDGNDKQRTFFGKKGSGKSKRECSERKGQGTASEETTRVWEHTRKEEDSEWDGKGKGREWGRRRGTKV